jgi:hypothetical protein
LIMKNNLFQFGNTFWLQLNGTAMGVSPSCVYATLYYAVHEAYFITKYPELQFYKRYIDDVIGIWIPKTDSDNQRWQEFQQDMNNFGQLRWDFSSRQLTINFLDLTLTINKKGIITTKIYEKAENLYLYLPATSCRPFNNIKGLIYGMVYRTIRLTSSRDDQTRELQNLVKRLTARGYQQSLLVKIINETYQRLATPPSRTSDLTNSDPPQKVCFFSFFLSPTKSEIIPNTKVIPRRNARSKKDVQKTSRSLKPPQSQVGSKQINCGISPYSQSGQPTVTPCNET